ncbi:MAG: hypothetical protein R3213_08410, partial [Flavobacteriaceae bacterium]|nr:hypothetical protein [Flavobacteriaceae bacterium]
DSTIITQKYNIQLKMNDSLGESLTLSMHGSNINLTKTNPNNYSLIKNIEQRRFPDIENQINMLKSNDVLPHYIGRPLLQTSTYNIFLSDGFENAYKMNEITKSLFPNDPVGSIIDYELYNYDSNTWGKIKTTMPLFGKVIKRYYTVITTDRIMNDDYNPFSGR